MTRAGGDVGGARGGGESQYGGGGRVVQLGLANQENPERGGAKQQQVAGVLHRDAVQGHVAQDAKGLLGGLLRDEPGEAAPREGAAGAEVVTAHELQSPLVGHLERASARAGTDL